MAGVVTKVDSSALDVARVERYPHAERWLQPGQQDQAASSHARPALRSDYSLSIVDTCAGFDALETEWNALFDRVDRGASLFQSYNWCWHWTRHYLLPAGTRMRLAIVTARRGGELVLVWPLVIERIAGLSQLVWMGGPAAQYGEALVDPAIDAKRVLAEAHRHLVSNVRADLLRLRLVRSDAAIADHLVAVGARITQTYEAPYLDLASARNFQDYETRYPAKARKNRRRLLRRLDERASVRFEDLRGGAAAGQMAAAAIRLKRQWLADRNLVSKALASERTLAFLADLAQTSVKPVGCEVSVLRSGSDIASIQIGFRNHDRLALHVIVFDLAFEKAGAGVLHLEHCIAQAFKDGVGVLDLLAPRSDYKMDWADGTAPVADYALPLTLKGRLFVEAYLLRLRPRLKRVAPFLPKVLRRLASTS